LARLFVIDDEEAICWGLRRLGESLGMDVRTASSAEEGLATIADGAPDVIVLDVRLPGMDGLTAVEHFRERVGPVPIVVITAYGDLQTAVDAVRKGAYEYIVKPFDIQQVERVLRRALESGQATGEAAPVIDQPGGLVGKSPAMQEVYTRIALAAASDACVLVYGESGTGKELVARAVHQYSRRADGPFVAVNVASLSPSLAESELFGHERGAFTGADQPRTGLMVQADTGTLFLDEVADIPLPTQVKLLRAVEHGEVLPVGSDQPVKTDFRVISATHRNLPRRVQEGEFREDLYYRLCAFQIDVPPLRERADDIIDLAEHFRSAFARRDGATAAPPAAATLNQLRQRPWYGNVRELRNAIEHALIVARGGPIQPEHLPAPVPDALSAEATGPVSVEQRLAGLVRRWAESELSDADGADELYDRLLRLVEPPLLTAALEAYHGQCATAARRLGLHRTTLRKKLDQYGVEE
jgi:two-component system nitrogen regulation response regulator GlnG